MNEKTYLYILMNQRNTTMYIGVAKHIAKRIREHQKENETHFAGKYNTDKLVYYEEFEKEEVAYKRERQLKNWHRGWKLNLIRSMNPNFEDIIDHVR